MTARKTTTKSQKPHEVPAYGIAEAARYLKIAPATLRAWSLGRSYPRDDGTAYFQPLIPLADPRAHLLSFGNLVEAHVLRALRKEHVIPVKALRTAMAYAEHELGVEHVLLNPKLRAADRQLFIEKYGALINLSRAGQLAMRQVLEDHLRRIEWKMNVPQKLYPYVSTESVAEKTIVIDPSIQFGRPMIVRRGVSTAVIVDRIDAGESIEEIAADYRLRPDEVRAAIVYEEAA
jgi:uncharacterized protein (DUF433 family)